jgi:hypothetical protein
MNTVQYTGLTWSILSIRRVTMGTDYRIITLRAGVLVKLKELPFKVKIFKLVSTNGDIEWVITNDLSVGMNAFVIELKNENRWQVEEFHMGFKQLRGSEKCQCRKAVSQRNHLSCCYLA